MSVSGSAEQSSETSGPDAYDSGGEDWEFGLGHLIVDLEADLEKDRRRSEMNRVVSVKSHADELPLFTGLSSAAFEPKRVKDKRRGSSEKPLQLGPGPGPEPGPRVHLEPQQAHKVCIGKRRDAQGRPGEAFAMNPLSDPSHPCAKGKDARKGKSPNKAGLKRDKDCVRARKDKHGEFGRTDDGMCYCADMDVDRGGTDGTRAAAAAAAAAFVARDDEGCSAETQNHDPLGIKTRSVGTNTHETDRVIESNYMEPCQPGTSVNLEGIVWHETEEGVLVVNVTWRKRTYVGTLLDCTKHDWAPPRFCESPMSESEMACRRGRGKRMRLSVSDQPVTEPGFSKIRGLTHKRRGVGIGNKGRRGSLNLGTYKTPAYYSVEDIKSSSLICGNRRSKAPADLDLSLVSDDIRNANGKRIRAKSRSAPSTPQGKSDPAFLEQVCTSPMLIDCPHPNCNKKYKHINGLRYHQLHAHLDSDNKQEFEAESEDRLSDYDESLASAGMDCSENLDAISKKPRTIYKLNANLPLKNRKLMLNRDHSPTANTKTVRNTVGKEGPVDDLSNLPLISNMSVVLENCLMTDRNSSIEMPKLEAEGIIDKRDIKKENVLERCPTKLRTSRYTIATPAPPKLIAIPTTFPTKALESPSHQPSPTVALTKTKNISLKSIKPKSDTVNQVNMANPALALSKDNKRKEKHKVKDRNYKDPRSPKTDLVFTKADEIKSISKDVSVSLLKEHLSKQDIVNGLIETQESRMASIRAEADKVYTFTDNAPSPSIGSSTRMDSGSLSNGDGSTKNNSPAYSDISDVTEDGGFNSRSRRNSAPDSNQNGTVKISNPPSSTAQSSTHNHGYESYSFQSYMHSGQNNPAAFLKASTPYVRAKDDGRELNEDPNTLDSSSESGSQSHVQLAMTQSQTALAQSLYYGQYARNAPTDQKVLIVPNPHRQQNDTCCEDLQCSKISRGQTRRGPEQKERTKEDAKPSTMQSVHKGTNSVKIGCTKPAFIYVDVDKQLTLQHPQAKTSFISKDQGHNKESEDFNSESQNTKTNVDTNVSYLNASESQSWSHSFQSKYMKQNQEVNKTSQDVDPDKGKEQQPRLEAELQRVQCETPSEDLGDTSGTEMEKMSSEASENLQGTRMALSSSQQSFIQYQHPYPYLHLCETNNTSYGVMSHAMVQNYPGFHYPLYGKTAEREDSSGMQNNKTEPTALELLHHHNIPYHSKSPVDGDHGGGGGEDDRDSEHERDTVPYAHHLHTHHHTHLGMSYTLVSGQYDPFQAEKKS